MEKLAGETPLSPPPIHYVHVSNKQIKNTQKLPFPKLLLDTCTYPISRAERLSPAPHGHSHHKRRFSATAPSQRHSAVSAPQRRLSATAPYGNQPTSSPSPSASLNQRRVREPVADAAHCFDVVAGGADFFAEALDVGVDGSRRDAGFDAPDVVEE